MDPPARAQSVPSVPAPHNQRNGSPILYHGHGYGHERSETHDSGPQRSSVTPPGPGPPGVGQDGAPYGGNYEHIPSIGCLLPPIRSPPHQRPALDHHHPQYLPPSQPSYAGEPSIGLAARSINSSIRKPLRATQACQQCRSRKQKCDEGTPCHFCKRDNLICEFRDTRPVKADTKLEELQSSVEVHTRGLDELTSKIEIVKRRLKRIEHSASSASHFITGGPHNISVVEEEQSPGNHKPQPEDYRATPHRSLLLWPTVRSLLRRAVINHNYGYVVEAEDRGLLRLWTHGEGIDENDGTQPDESASPASSDESGGRLAETTSANSVWGVRFLSTGKSEARGSEPHGSSGVKANGEIDLDQNTINALYDSYMCHIHIMHPILDQRRLRRMFDNFIEHYSTGRLRSAFANSTLIDVDQKRMKRRRTHGVGGEDVVYSDDDVRGDPPERSPGNAVIYLVMALGEICLHKDALSAIKTGSKLQANLVVPHDMTATPSQTTSSPLSATADIKSSSKWPDPTLTTTQAPPTSESGTQLNDSPNRRSSLEEYLPASSGLRTTDVIPGIIYYAKAAEILGDQAGGNDLVHAQMFLLAGLYKDQLARVKESMSWLTVAGRAIMILLDRYQLYDENYWSAFEDATTRFKTGQTRIKDTRQSLIVVTSWTCLQLESDILAELRLPSSGSQSIEDWLLMPQKAPRDEPYQELESDGENEDEDDILTFYTAQLYLCRRLNKIHRQMYGAECIDQPLREVQEMIKGHEDILQQWRATLPSRLSWHDGDEPPSDALNARLRGGYYSARYIVSRPFLDYILHIMPGLNEGYSMEIVARDCYSNPRDKADIHLFHAIEQMEVADIWQGARHCIDAAMHSIVAFDGVPDRFITTNIHGTAHAQFAHVLVLCTSFEAEHVKHLISPGLLKARLRRTITFLGGLAPISPTSRADRMILEKINALLFPAADDDIYLRRPDQ